jgi:outer membrane protein TolC
VEQERQLAAQKMLLDTTLEYANLQFRLGAIHRLDLLVAEQASNEVGRRLLQAAQTRETAYRRLRQVAFLDEEPEQPIATLSALSPASASDAPEFFLQVAQQAQELASAEQSLALRDGRPEASIGYFNQSIRPDVPLQGVLLGLSVPLYRKGFEARREQAALQQSMAQLDLERTLQQYKEQWSQAESVFNLLQEELQTYGKDLESMSEELRKLALLQLRAGEIDYFRYQEILSLALERDLERYELIHRYNQALLRLLYLSNQL